MIGDLPGFGMVWLYQEGIANILSLSKVTEHFQVTYNSKDEEGFCVEKPDVSVRYFKNLSKGCFILR
eukprot:272917-Ditylum_brightwellii.AAC.1